VSAIGLDIVFPFGKMSTESGQAQTFDGIAWAAATDKRLIFLW
jgi:hypothetical protein